MAFEVEATLSLSLGNLVVGRELSNVDSPRPAYARVSLVPTSQPPFVLVSPSSEIDLRPLTVDYDGHQVSYLYVLLGFFPSLFSKTEGALTLQVERVACRVGLRCGLFANRSREEL